MNNSLKEKYGEWALVAGASEGLGVAFARSLAARGINLVLLARRLTLLEKISAELEAEFKVQTQCFQVDLADLDVLNSTLNSLSKQIGLLVYNAAYSPISYFKDIETTQLMQVIDVNVKAPLYLVKRLSKGMISRRRGGIILMSSLAGQQGSPKIATYAATKAFNTILSEGLWKELKSEGVDVVASIAGAIRTPGYTLASEKKDAPGTLEAHEVAEKTLKALSRGPVVIPGFFNKFANYFMSRLLGRRQRVNIMYSNTKKLQ